MSKKRILMSVVLAAVVMTMTGCVAVPGVVMDKSKPIEQNRYTVVGDEVSATECTVYLFGFPVSDIRGSAGRRMYKNALSQAPGADALIEYTCDYTGLDLFVLNLRWYTLAGTPVKTDK